MQKIPALRASHLALLRSGCSLAMSCFPSQKVSLFHFFFNDPYGLGVITLLFLGGAKDR